MHLKSLEICGFKSFPLRTKLEFGKGMTAIVGPNGCGKSNISDAIRWVLGEQSAKLLRGTKMEDCIFNGTEARKPLGMAEVSLTFSDCEKTISTEFHEITVTRRVFRSGEGQYFINKTPCRLKDIQRLFMDTGVGTNSYSLMEQGRVDLILSSRPEDRRAVFEEASGITKYKTDKREALRKLEHTEANLVRLADIIKEVKRQIISLQRQAGKARRAQSLRQELKTLDIFVARERINSMDTEIENLEAKMSSGKETMEASHQEIQGIEQASESMRDALSEIELEISDASGKDGKLKADLERAEQSISAYQTRLDELRELLERDSNEGDRAAEELSKQNDFLNKTQDMLEKAKEDSALSEKLLADKTRQLAEHDLIQEKTQASIENLYSDAMDLENQALKLQNQLHDMEVRDRSTAGRLERTEAEQSNLTRVLQGYEKHMAEFAKTLEQLKAAGAKAESELNDAKEKYDGLTKDIESARRAREDCTLRISGLQAKEEIVNKSLAERGELPSGIQQLLHESGPSSEIKSLLKGALFDQLDTKPEFRIPLEAVLRPMLDAVVVDDLAGGMNLLRLMETNEQGPARILAANVSESGKTASKAAESAIPLSDMVSCPAQIRSLVHRLLSNTWVVEKLENIPNDVSADATYVTFKGSVVRGSGAMEIYRRGAESGNPLALKHEAMDARESITKLESELKAHDAGLAALAEKRSEYDESVAKHRALFTERQNALARKEGEYLGIAGQAERVRENLETVALELQELRKQGGSSEERNSITEKIELARSKARSVRENIANQKTELQKMALDRKLLSSEETEARLSFSKHKQTLEHLEAQHGPLAERIRELERLIQDRASRTRTYRSDIERHIKLTADTQKQIPSIKEEIERNQNQLVNSRERRIKAHEEWQISIENLKARRAALDALREKQNELNTQLIEQRMKRSAVIERITSEYKMPPDAIAQGKEPEWPDGRPDMDTLENTTAELRAKIEAMGPVYDGAIEEYRQLEERFEFLQNQQNDLVQSKQQLMDMIRKINRTTTELFAQTFAVINQNFQDIFKRLFGGGSAKLMLADEEDVLESGIEIIARPPGKRLQSVSLLSGGERALTAVSLLFAIYLVKPSPFCVLDELDAPLDETNIGRFIKILESFLEHSQFVVITHNRQTISAADVLYGITMEEFGVSKVVSMKFTNREKPNADQPAAKAEAPATV